MKNMQEFGIQLEWKITATRISLTTRSTRSARSTTRNPTMCAATWNIWGTREHARSVAVSVVSLCLAVVTLIPCTSHIGSSYLRWRFIPCRIHWRDPRSYLESSWIPDPSSNKIEMRKFVSKWTILRTRISHITWRNQNIFDTNRIGGFLSISLETQPLRNRSDFNEALSSPRNWRTTNQADVILEVSATAPIIEFFFQLMVMEFLVEFLIIQRKSTNEDACKSTWYNGETRCVRSLYEASDERFVLLFSILLQLDRLKLTFICCNRREL